MLARSGNNFFLSISKMQKNKCCKTIGSVLAAAEVREIFLPYFVGGLEKSLMEQVREMVEPGFTNTELLPWITAAAAGGDCLVILVCVLFRHILPGFQHSYTSMCFIKTRIVTLKGFAS